MPRQLADPRELLPLTPVVFEILVALADQDLHGYAIMQEVAQRTSERVRLRPGTLYRAIDRLLDQGLIEEAENRPDPELDDERRVYYRMTQSGREVARAEAERLAAAVASARRKKLLRGRV